MESILAWRFSPLNLSVVPGFPNFVPTINEWGDFFPRFREHRHEKLVEHFLEFHELMN